MLDSSLEECLANRVGDTNEVHEETSSHVKKRGTTTTSSSSMPATAFNGSDNKRDGRGETTSRYHQRVSPAIAAASVSNPTKRLTLTPTTITTASGSSSPASPTAPQCCLANIHHNNNDGLGWQSTKACVRERVAFMLLNEHLADVEFVFGGGAGHPHERMPAHKFVLSIGSTVFDAMFKFDEEHGHSRQQQSQNRIQVIHI